DHTPRPRRGGVADGPLGVDHEDRPPVEPHRTEDAVGPAHRLVHVGQQGEGEAAVVAGEPVVALDRLGADGPDGGVDLEELVDVGGVAVELAGAHRGVFPPGENEHGRPAPQLGQLVVAVALGGAVGAGQGERGGGVADPDRAHPASTVSRMASGMSKLACTAWTSSWWAGGWMSRSTFLALSAVSRATVDWGTIVRSAESMAMPASSSAVRTACRSVGGGPTRPEAPPAPISSPPAGGGGARS